MLPGADLPGGPRRAAALRPTRGAAALRLLLDGQQRHRALHRARPRLRGRGSHTPHRVNTMMKLFH